MTTVADLHEQAQGRWPQILSLLGICVPTNPKQHGPCPACGGKDRFRFDDKDGRGTWFCNVCMPHAGDGLALVQRVRGGTFPETMELVGGVLGVSSPNVHATRTIVATYDYTDEAGNLLFQVVRSSPKGFRQRRPDGQGGWIWNLQGIEPVLYRLPAVVNASSVLVVEGEKDVDTAYRLGLPDGWAATCNPMGAGKWRDSYTAAIRGKEVIILPDADEPGEKHAVQVAQALQGYAASVHRLTLANGLKDLSQWAEIQAEPDISALLQQATLWSLPTVQIKPPLTEVPQALRPQLDRLALRGVLGDLVQAIEPHSEADPAALLIQAIAAYGNVVHRGPHFRAEADAHHLNVFAALVGETSKGRKGTSWGYIRRVFALVDPDWTSQRVMSGLSSGEGVIWAVRDPITKEEPVRERGKPTGEYQTVVVDRGIEDKRLLVVESEFASTLRVMGRDGNTLSAVVRQAWDMGDLRTMTRNSPAQATGAHISIIVHITRDELCRLMEANEASNGFCNRFLWLCVERSKTLPEGGHFNESDLSPLIQRLNRAVQFGRSAGEVRRDEPAREMWRTVYPVLSEGKPGLLGAVTSRGEAQVMRLAALYAIQDMSYVVRPEHLTAALALWEYCEASARYIFGQRLGDPVADELLTALSTHPQGLTRTEIRDWFGRNRKSHEIDRGLSVLAKQGRARKDVRQSGGRPIEHWSAAIRVTT